MRRVAAALAIGIAGAAAAEGVPTPLCVVEASVEPMRAVVGEQVLYRVRIASRDDVASVEWSHPPAFPGFRTELLPGDPQPSRAGARDVRVRDERRALFAERAGSHVLRAPDLRCTAGEDPISVVTVPGVRLEVEPPPEADRPEGFDGLVGPLTLHLTVTPRRVFLGESVRLALMARGSGNLWTLASPFPADAFAGAEIFARRPELVLERGRSLFLRRHFVYDVVPRSEGVLRVPAIALPWFDPVSDAYRMARTKAIAVEVGPRAAASDPGGAGPDAGSPARVPAHWRPGPFALAALVLLVAVAATVAWRWRSRAGDDAGAAFEEARAAAAEGDRDRQAAALARALRSALARHVDDASAVAPEELMARRGLAPAVGAAAHLLAALERARFDPEAPPPDPDAVRRAIADL